MRWLATPDRIRSAIRPAQPVLPGAFPRSEFHWSCWSLCEKSCGGSVAEPLKKDSRVTGSISGPTLVTNAALPWSNRVFSPVIDGCRP